MKPVFLLFEASKESDASIELIEDQNTNSFDSTKLNYIGFLPDSFIISTKKGKVENSDEKEIGPVKAKIRISQGFDRYHYYGSTLSSSSSRSNKKKVVTIDILKDLTENEMLSKLKNSFLLPLLGRECEIFSFLGIDSNVRDIILQYIDPIELFRMRRVCKVIKAVIDDESNEGLFSILAQSATSYIKHWVKFSYDCPNYGGGWVFDIPYTTETKELGLPSTPRERLINEIKRIHVVFPMLDRIGEEVLMPIEESASTSNSIDFIDFTVNDDNDDDDDDDEGAGYSWDTPASAGINSLFI